MCARDACNSHSINNNYILEEKEEKLKFNNFILS